MTISTCSGVIYIEEMVFFCPFCTHLPPADSEVQLRCGLFILLESKMNTLCLSFSSRKRSSVSWNPCSWLSSWCLFSALFPATSQFHGLHRRQACYCHSNSKHGLLEQSRNPLRLLLLLRTFSPNVFSCLITWWHFIMQSACLCWEWNEKQRGSHVQRCSAGTGVSMEKGGAGSL